MNKNLINILDTCLERIALKGDTVEQCLESNAAHRAELEPLLRAASSAGKTLAIEPRPAFRQASRARLLSTIAAAEESRGKRRLYFWRWQRGWAVALSIVLALLIAGSSTVAAASGSLPGDTLYPVKTATEKVQAFFTFGDEARANFHMKLAERRIEELNSLAEKNRRIPGSVLGAIRSETDRAIGFIDRNEQPGEALIARLVNLTTNQKIVLARLITNASPEARQRLREALNRSEVAHGRATILRDRLTKPEVPQLTPRQLQQEQKALNKKSAAG